MMIHQPTFFAVTGGPGAGKTTLLRHLQGLGETVVSESARAVIQAEIRRTGVRPDGERFWRLTLAADVAAFHATTGRAFFDRSLVDSWAMARMGDLPCAEADMAVRNLRYNRMAFIAPPWREIYVQDDERIQTWAQAIASYEACHAAYEAAGYELVELPRTDVARRAAFVLEIAAGG